MSRVCQVTGRAPSFGNAISHSHRRTRRRFDPNIQNKRYWLPSEQRFVKLRLSVKGMRVIDARGIERVVAEIRARGGRV
ncbi:MULTISPECIES: 50S ribosomal protein L28 [Nocardiopsis]|uniref:50S ribosomal protein L28 n=1 Tax=Nocardiopsis TaxID=2013 RepID=UPI00034D5F06|nr:MULTISPECIES: 50S ribosomal protein L28 [Nocardiopsis]PWV57419.1 LSU ribosomal protein L28P [Nocardiopsis sp. L17-MgMaSL7]